ncbi:MAG: hypothetical protein MR301_06405 [Prevotella sp.]|nr:hypothetical protein [Prevotella sp.]MDD7046828.1 hypothetical protein [Prevotella sp.]MDY5545794.1 hypothetical protein [Prevotella sp.]
MRHLRPYPLATFHLRNTINSQRLFGLFKPIVGSWKRRGFSIPDCFPNVFTAIRFHRARCTDMTAAWETRFIQSWDRWL